MSTRILFVLLLLLLGACSSTKSREMAEEQALKSSATDARLQLEDFVTLFTNQVERAADQIAQEVPDVSIKRNTVYYKLRIIPVVRRSLDRADEQAIMMDLWLFANVMFAFSDSQAGATYFGGHQEPMREAGEQLQASAHRLAKSLMTPEQFEKAKAGIQDFLASHEIDEDLEVPEDTQQAWTSVVTSSLGKPISAVTKTFRSINFTAGISDTAVAIHQASAEVARAQKTIGFMPTDVRWQIQLLLLEIEENLSLTSVVESVDRTSKSAESFARTAETLPADLRVELTSFVDEIDDKQANLQTTLNEVDTVMASADKVAESLTTTSEALTKTFEAFDTAMVTILGPPADPDAPPPPPKDPNDESKPFDITEYGDTAERLTETATALTALLAEAKLLEESPAAPVLIEDTGAMARSVVNQVFLAGGLFVLFTAVVMLAYKLLAAKLRSGS